MFCKYCGTRVEDEESLFCGNCGSSLHDEPHNTIQAEIGNEISSVIDNKAINSDKNNSEIKKKGLTYIKKFKIQIESVLSNFIQIIQYSKYRNLVIAASIAIICAIGAGIYFGYDAEIIAKNTENQATADLSKKAKTTQTSQSTTSTKSIQTTTTSTTDRQAYDVNEFEFITKAQREDDKSIFGESAKSIVLKYLVAVSDGKYHEAYNLLSPSRKEKVGEYNVWVKKFSVFDKRLDITNIEVVKVNENEAVIRYSGIQSLLMYNTNVRANGIAKVIRNGLDISIDEIL